MKKKEFLEYIQHTLTGGAPVPDNDSRYDLRTIAAWATMAIESMEASVEANPNKNEILTQLNRNLKTFVPVPVLYNTVRDEYYSVLPASVINLPRNRGIRMISPTKDQQNRFIYRENNSSSVFDNLEVSTLIKNVRFYVEGNTVFYNKRMTTDIASAGVLMRLVVPFSELNNSDEINIPTGKAFEVASMVMDKMRNMPPEDQVNNNDSKQV